MAWRNWSVVVVLILANYIVFSTLATFVFPPTPLAAPTHAAQATFTPGMVEFVNVGTLTYDFLTPTLTSTPAVTATVPARSPVPTTALKPKK